MHIWVAVHFYDASGTDPNGAHDSNRIVSCAIRAVPFFCFIPRMGLRQFGCLCVYGLPRTHKRFRAASVLREPHESDSRYILLVRLRSAKLAFRADRKTTAKDGNEELLRFCLDKFIVKVIDTLGADTGYFEPRGLLWRVTQFCGGAAAMAFPLLAESGAVVPTAPMMNA